MPHTHSIGQALCVCGDILMFGQKQVAELFQQINLVANLTHRETWAELGRQMHRDFNMHSAEGCMC